MKRLFLTLCFIAVAIGGMNADPVDWQKAQQLGAKFLGDSQLRLAATATDRGVADYYAFNVSNGEGFVIVAADDRVKPILAYSTTGRFDPDRVSEGFQFTLDAFCEEIQYVREHNLSATPDIIAEWESVSETGNLFNGRQANAVVGPLCQTLWDQDSPWNSQCPTDPQGPGGHVYAGCIATALGMVMKYHDWPNHGEGSHSYSFSGGYGQQTANFGETDYHFELMPFTLDSLSTEEDYYYIAQLLRHIGIGVEMVYGPYSSVSSSGVVGSALRSYFRYNCDVYKQKDASGNHYSNEEWAQMLKNGGLDEHLPLFYSGSDDTYGIGHAFVCDGYDENDYFHVNWGLSGQDNAWCPIGALNYTSYSFNTASCESKSLLAKYTSESSVIIIQASPFDYSHGSQTPVSIIPGGPTPRVSLG